MPLKMRAKELDVELLKGVVLIVASLSVLVGSGILATNLIEKVSVLIEDVGVAKYRVDELNKQLAALDKRKDIKEQTLEDLDKEIEKLGDRFQALINGPTAQATELVKLVEKEGAMKSLAQFSQSQRQIEGRVSKVEKFVQKPFVLYTDTIRVRNSREDRCIDLNSQSKNYSALHLVYCKPPGTWEQNWVLKKI